MSDFFPVVSGGGVTEERLLDKTFIMGITCDTPGDLTVAFTTNDCRYDKIGRYVKCSVALSFTLTYTTAAGALLFTGFPFNAEPNNCLGMLQFQSGSVFTWPVTASTIALALQSSNSSARLQGNKSGATTNTATIGTFASGTAYTIRFKGEYKSAA